MRYEKLGFVSSRSFRSFQCNTILTQQLVKVLKDIAETIRKLNSYLHSLSLKSRCILIASRLLYRVKNDFRVKFAQDLHFGLF